MIPLVLLLALSVASAQDADTARDDADDVLFGMRWSLERVGLDLDATVPVPGGERESISHSGAGVMVGLEYVVVTHMGLPLQQSLGLFFQAPFVDGDLTTLSFYTPMTVGSWIDLGSRFRINASFRAAFAHYVVQSDSPASTYRQTSLSVGPLVGLSYLIADARAEQRIELTGGASSHLMKSVIYNDGSGWIEADRNVRSFNFESPTIRLSYLAILP